MTLVLIILANNIFILMENDFLSLALLTAINDYYIGKMLEIIKLKISKNVIYNDLLFGNGINWRFQKTFSKIISTKYNRY